MIRRLYKEYRIQIIIAFALVILENFAYVAEPYVFGKAIDGLREAHRVEEEVDTALSTFQRREIADSIRARVVDSMKMIDSLQRLDSLSSSESDDGTRTNDEHTAPAIWHSYVHLAAFFTGHNSKTAALDSEMVPLPQEGTPERARIDSIRRRLARFDSIRSRQRRKKHPQMTREAVRDSILKAHAAGKPSPGPGKPAGTTTQPSPQPLAFYITREVGPFLPPLIPWVLLFLINSSVGAFRRVYDTRTYTKMFANLSSDVVSRQLAQGEDLSKVAARSAMAWHNIEFFQYNVPEFLEQLIAVGGAVIALGLFDWRLTVVGSVLIVFVAVGSKYYMNSLSGIQSTLHDQYEDEFNVFGTREPAKIRSYYSNIADLEIKYSVRSTLSYGVVRFFLLIMFLSTLYILDRSRPVHHWRAVFDRGVCLEFRDGDRIYSLSLREVGGTEGCVAEDYGAIGGLTHFLSTSETNHARYSLY